MSAIRIGYRYSKALLDLALEQGKLEEVYQDILGFQKSLESKEFSSLLKSPVIPTEKKSSIFKSLFEEKATPITYRFFQLIIKKGREVLFEDIVKSFIDEYRKHKNIVLVTLTTVDDTDQKTIEHVKEILENSGAIKSDIEVVHRKKPNLIGGFTIEFKDKLIDASISHKMDKLRRELGINLFKSKIRSI